MRFALIAAAIAIGTAGCDRERLHFSFAEASSRSASPVLADPRSPQAPATAALAEGPRQRAAALFGDTVTTGRVKAAIARDPGMKDSDVSVSTDDGVVTLSGSVKSAEQVTIAANLAQRQEGVARVESRLSVR